MSFLHTSAHSEHDSRDERRGAIYLPDGLALKLLCVCDAATGLEFSEPDSPIHSDLEDLWSSILASSVGSIGSGGAEEDLQKFAERYGLAHCLEGSDVSWLMEVGDFEAPSEDLYKEILEAAFGNPSGGAAFENGGCDASSQTEDLFLNFEAGESVESPAETTQLSPYLDIPDIPRTYHNRPHTPQVVYVNLAQKNYHDSWEIPNLMKKPSLFPPTLRNIKNWIFWRRVYGRR